MPTKFNNSFIIRNKNIVSGLPSSDPVKLIELLDKIGVIKKSRAKKESISKAMAKTEAKAFAKAKAKALESGDLKGYSMIAAAEKKAKKEEAYKGKYGGGEPIIEEPAEPSNRFQSRPTQKVTFPQPPPLTYAPAGSIESIQNMNRQIENARNELKLLEGSNNPLIEDIKNKTENQLARLTDRAEKIEENVNKLGLNTGYLYGALGSIQSQKFRGSEKEEEEKNPKMYSGLTRKIDPFENVRRPNDNIDFVENEQPDTEERPITNQGSQDIPEKLLNVDVSPGPDEIVEDEDIEPGILVKETPIQQLQQETTQFQKIPKDLPRLWHRKVTNSLGIENRPYETAPTTVLKDYLKTLSEKTGITAMYNLKNELLWGQINSQLYSLYEGNE